MRKIFSKRFAVQMPMIALSRLQILFLCALATFGGAVDAIAGPMTVKMTLVWGTDEEKPKDPTLKPADPKMVATFREMCKWKHYFEVTNTVTTLAQNATNKVRLSPKAEVEVSNLGSMGLAAKFYGEHKLIYEGKSKVETGKHWGIAGGDKNSTAWFVILTPQ
jgi:hypothetical protein